MSGWDWQHYTVSITWFSALIARAVIPSMVDDATAGGIVALLNGLMAGCGGWVFGGWVQSQRSLRKARRQLEVERVEWVRLAREYSQLQLTSLQARFPTAE